MCGFWRNSLVLPPCSCYLLRWGFIYHVISLLYLGVSITQFRLRFPTQMHICHPPSFGQHKTWQIYEVCNSSRECKQGLPYTVLATAFYCKDGWMRLWIKGQGWEEGDVTFLLRKINKHCKIINIHPFLLYAISVRKDINTLSRSFKDRVYCSLSANDIWLSLLVLIWDKKRGKKVTSFERASHKGNTSCLYKVWCESLA